MGHGQGVVLWCAGMCVSCLPGGGDLALAEQLAKTAAGKFQVKDHGISSGKGNVLLIVDPANMTESSSHPHLRKGQVSQQLVDRAVNVGMLTRWIARTGNKEMDVEGGLGDDDVWIMFDGGRQVENIITRPFRKIPKQQKHAIMLSYSEACLMNNVGRVTSIGSLKCTETMYIVATEAWTIPRRSRLHYEGSNYSDQLGPILVDSWEDPSTWQMTRKQKKALMGRFRVEVGGGVDPGLAGTSKWKNRETEPVWFHQKPELLDEEVIHSFFWQSNCGFRSATRKKGYGSNAKAHPLCRGHMHRAPRL